MRTQLASTAGTEGGSCYGVWVFLSAGRGKRSQSVAYIKLAIAAIAAKIKTSNVLYR